jgi:hypothetical protein
MNSSAIRRDSDDDEEPAPRGDDEMLNNLGMTTSDRANRTSVRLHPAATPSYMD